MKHNKFLITFGKAFCIVGSSALLVCIISLGVGLITAGDTALAFNIIAVTFAGLGSVFSAIGIISLLLAHKQVKKIERLTNNGICYNAEVVRIYDNLYTNINYRHPIIAECTYQDNNGNTCIVKSKNIWPPCTAFTASDITARVWVNPGDPRDYFVDLRFNHDKEDVKYDYDYR